MSAAREYASAVSHGGKLFVLGGYNSGAGTLSSMESFDPSTNVWTTSLATMPYARDHFASAVLLDFIYSVGASSSLPIFSFHVTSYHRIHLNQEH